MSKPPPHDRLVRQRIDLVSEFVTGQVKAHVDVIYVGGDAAMVGRNGLVGSAQARYVL
jgi:hypothetical protein